MDFAGIVFYPRFLEMLNDLVEDWFAEALDRPFSKMHDSGQGESQGIPTVDLKVQFKSPARIGDQITKTLWVKNTGKASVTIGFDFKHVDGSICLEGEATLVNVGLDKPTQTIKSAAFEDETRQKINQFLK